MLAIKAEYIHHTLQIVLIDCIESKIVLVYSVNSTDFILEVLRQNKSFLSFNTSLISGM